MYYEELVKSLRQCAEASCAGCKNDLVEIGCRGKLQIEAANAIEKLSKERKTGKWEVDEVGCGICSACGNFAFETTTHHISGWYPRFCPNCGAKMEAPTDV